MTVILNKIKCLLWGHVKSDRNTTFTSIYIEEPWGAFYQGHRYVYDGRLYRCKRCGVLIHVHGILSWELEDLITVTLEDLPANFFGALNNQNYEFCRIYKRDTHETT